MSISYNEQLHPCERRTKRKKRLLVCSHYFFFSATIIIILITITIIIIIILVIFTTLENQSTRYCKISFHGEASIQKQKIFQYLFRSCAFLIAKTSLIFGNFFLGLSTNNLKLLNTFLSLSPFVCCSVAATGRNLVDNEQKRT